VPKESFRGNAGLRATWKGGERRDDSPKSNWWRSCTSTLNQPAPLKVILALAELTRGGGEKNVLSGWPCVKPRWTLDQTAYVGLWCSARVVVARGVLIACRPSADSQPSTSLIRTDPSIVTGRFCWCPQNP